MSGILGGGPHPTYETLRHPFSMRHQRLSSSAEVCAPEDVVFGMFEGMSLRSEGRVEVKFFQQL